MLRHPTASEFHPFSRFTGKVFNEAELLFSITFQTDCERERLVLDGFFLQLELSSYYEKGGCFRENTSVALTSHSLNFPNLLKDAQSSIKERFGGSPYQTAAGLCTQKLKVAT